MERQFVLQPSLLQVGLVVVSQTLVSAVCSCLAQRWTLTLWKHYQPVKTKWHFNYQQHDQIQSTKNANFIWVVYWVVQMLDFLSLCSEQTHAVCLWSDSDNRNWCCGLESAVIRDPASHSQCPVCHTQWAFLNPAKHMAASLGF